MSIVHYAYVHTHVHTRVHTHDSTLDSTYLCHVSFFAKQRRRGDSQHPATFRHPDPATFQHPDPATFRHPDPATFRCTHAQTCLHSNTSVATVSSIFILVFGADRNLTWANLATVGTTATYRL